MSLWAACLDWRASLYREVRRKAIHLTGLSVPAAIILTGKFNAVAFVALALAVSLILEVLRLHGKIRLPAVRETERNRVAGYVYFIAGALVTVALFQPMVAVLSMIMLCLGDTASGITGSMLQGSDIRSAPRDPHKRRIKPLPAGAAIFSVSLLAGYVSSGITGLSPPIYLAGAVGATIADMVPVFLGRTAIDDNFTIPIFSGTAMSLAALAL